MTNREKLLKTSEYDLLVRMNNYMLGGGCFCVLDALTGNERSCASDIDCSKCIAAWLNEETEEGTA